MLGGRGHQQSDDDCLHGSPQHLTATTPSAQSCRRSHNTSSLAAQDTHVHIKGRVGHVVEKHFLSYLLK